MKDDSPEICGRKQVGKDQQNWSREKNKYDPESIGNRSINRQVQQCQNKKFL